MIRAEIEGRNSRNPRLGLPIQLQWDADAYNMLRIGNTIKIPTALSVCRRSPVCE